MERYSNKRIMFRTGTGQYRKAQASDIGIMGVCPKCNHFMVQVYEGSRERGAFVDPTKFRNRCLCCEPMPAEPEVKQSSIIMAKLRELAEKESAGPPAISSQTSR